jgi:hypothetical protein
MSRDENILRAYCHGDAEERIDIYLAHPCLRTRFDEIERNEERGSPPGKAVNGKTRFWRFWSPFTAERRARQA